MSAGIRPARAATVAARVVPLVLVLTACAPTVSLTPAPAATSAACAGIVVRLPSALGSAEQRQTDAQGTGAWGSPASVVLRCGVPPTGPTTAPCYTVGAVDWVVLRATDQQYALQTFGRSPSTEVVVDRRRIAVSDALPALSEAVAAAVPRAAGRCSGPAAPATESPVP